ncbi:hypothetical protein ACFO7V_16700 [Glutamicibacter bergerei]|uniref:Uncharacterized protein n=1 Tax=Glutamicibacter bergerei TaxID=256702 RepID=A0ABV9MSX8_9MICC
MSDYTPSLSAARNAYSNGSADRISQQGADSEFERFIAKTKADALTDLADQMRDRFTASWIRGKARELTHGPRKITGAFAVTESEADCGDNDL